MFLVVRTWSIAIWFTLMIILWFEKENHHLLSTRWFVLKYGFDYIIIIQSLEMNISCEHILVLCVRGQNQDLFFSFFLSGVTDQRQISFNHACVTLVRALAFTKPWPLCNWLVSHLYRLIYEKNRFHSILLFLNCLAKER